MAKKKANNVTLLTRARSAAVEMSNIDMTMDEMATLCLDLLERDDFSGKMQEFANALSPLPVGERHYWVGTFYTLLLSPERRRSQAAYFTPPHIAEAVVDVVLHHGFDLSHADVLDPAAGGAAFLSTIAARMVRVGLAPLNIIHRLNGIEIDAGLAAISERLIRERLRSDEEREVIAVGDALSMKPLAAYNLVIANPPYGRISPADLADDAWKAVAHSGHVNKYAVFTEYCFRAAKPGGLVALVIPSSFRAGPLYDLMRKYVRSQGQVLTIANVANRKDVFVDVAQDVSVLVVRKGPPHVPKHMVSFPVISDASSPTASFSRKLPVDPSKPWPVPSVRDDVRGNAVLADYGVKVRAGYFVWNREDKRKAEEGSADSYPLIWAKNVKQGRTCKPEGKSGDGADFVTVDASSSAIVRGPAIVMQRTTNNKQPRRLISATVDESVVEKWGGFITENHTIVLTADDRNQLSLVEKLLNTKAVDDRYRAVAGTASISVMLLRDLDLPRPEAFRKALTDLDGDSEAAAEVAYGGKAKSRETVNS